MPFLFSHREEAQLGRSSKDPKSFPRRCRQTSRARNDTKHDKRIRKSGALAFARVDFFFSHP